MKKLVVVFLSITLLTGCAEKKMKGKDASGINAFTTEGTDWPRTITDATGHKIFLKAHPQRVALLLFHHYEPLLILDIVPIAATDVETVYKSWASLRPYAERLDIIDIGGTQSPNLEKLVGVNPDLIIYLDGVHNAVAENLQRIAPTIAVGMTGSWATWQGVIREYGKIFGREEKAEFEISRLENLIKDAKGKLTFLNEKTFVFIHPNEKTFYQWKPDYVFNAQGGLGLKNPLAESMLLSFEGLGSANPDYIVFYNDATNDADEIMLDRLNNEKSVWTSLAAVKQGHVFMIDKSAFSGGPLGIEVGINGLLENLTK